MRHAAPGDTVIDQFPVFDDDGYTKISGLTTPDFSAAIWANAIPKSTILTIAEIGSSGEYKLSYIPDISGYWKVEIQVNFNHEIFVSDAEVNVPDSVAILEELNQIKDGGTGLFTPADSLHMSREELNRILGLLHYNAIIDNQIYDSNIQLTSAILRVFDSSLHVPAIPGGSETVGLLYQYDINAEYAGMGLVNMYRLRKVL